MWILNRWVFVVLTFISANLFKSVCHGEKILVIAFVSTKSHKLLYMPFLDELGKRGHNVTVLSPIKPMTETKHVNEILTIDVDKLQLNFLSNPLKMKEDNVHQQPFANIEWFTKICRETYDLPHVTALMEESFDLIIMQPMLNECAFGMVHRINAPLILFMPTAVPNFISSRLGSHFPPSFIPGLFFGMPTEMNFLQRFKSFYYDVWMYAFVKFIYESAVQAVYTEKVGQDTPSIDAVYSNVSLILSNSHFSLNNHKPLLPDIVEIGGIHSRPPNPLPKDLEDFINSGNEGFIYFSMGSAIKGHTMGEEKRKLFLNVFAKLKQQVIWKWETETMPDLPPNILLRKFLPQQDLLGHKNIKLFMTHCGGGSLEEGIYHAVPSIALPIFGDQTQNAQLAKVHGHIIDLDWNALTEESLLATIQEMLKNPKFQDNANKISAIFRDQPDGGPMARAIYYVEYVLRHKGAPHLRSSVGRKLNFFQYHSFDVIFTYLIILSVFVLTVCWSCCKILRCCKPKYITDVKKLKRE